MVFEGVYEEERQTNQDLTPEYPHHFTVVFQGLYGQEQFSHQVISNSSATFFLLFSFFFQGARAWGVAGWGWGAGRQRGGQVDKDEAMSVPHSHPSCVSRSCFREPALGTKTEVSTEPENEMETSEQNSFLESPATSRV